MTRADPRRGGTARALLAVPAALLLLAAALWAIPTAYVQLAGVVVTGQVLEKRERIEMPGGDDWRHALDVVYWYRPLDSDVWRIASHPVDADRFDHLRVGAPVRVRYSPWPVLRWVQGIGSWLDGTSALSRVRWRSGLRRGGAPGVAGGRARAWDDAVGGRANGRVGGAPGRAAADRRVA